MAPQSPPCDGKAGIAQRAVHQLGDAIGDLLDAKARLPRLERQAVAGQRWRDDGEGVRGIAAKARGIGEPRDQFQKLEDRARPAVQQQQRAGSRPLAGHVQEMQIDTAERHLELREGVQPRFLGAPVKRAVPIFDELTEVPDIGAIRPRVPWRLVGETGAGRAGRGDRRLPRRELSA